jgi:hypothetical protein
LRRNFLISTALFALSACHHAAPVAAAPPPPPVAPAPPAQPPPAASPARTCETLADNCLAAPGSALAIGNRGAWLVPPAGWVFAKLPEHSIAIGPDGKALLAAVAINAVDDKDVLAAMEKLAGELTIEDVKWDSLKHRLSKPQTSLDAGGAPLALWEINKNISHGSNPQIKGKGEGTLLAFHAKLAGDEMIVGVGFVVVPDAEAEAAQVMQSLQSLKGKQ